MATALDIVRKRFPQVNQVVDARKGMTIEVSSRDVSSAAKKDKGGCVMAVACKRKLKLDGVIISTNRAYMIKGTKAVRFSVPESVSREITSFDRGSDFASGTYSLTHICKSSRLGVRPRHGATANKTGRQRAARHITEGIRAVLGSKEDK